MKKGLTILISGLAATTLLAGCGAKTSTTKKTSDHERTTKAATPAKHHEVATPATTAVAPTTLVAPGPATVQLARAQVVLPAMTPRVTNQATPRTATPTPVAPQPSTKTPATNQQPNFPVAQLNANQLSQQQEFGLYAWYTSHYVTHEATPVAPQGLTVTAMRPSNQQTALPAGTNNTYYLVYGATPNNGEWVNYYAKGTANNGGAAPVYVYNQNQWNPYTVNQMVDSANQNNGAGYVNRVANQVHFYDER